MSYIRGLSVRTLASTALVALLGFPVLVAGLNLIQHDQYSPVRQAMSDLALGRAGWIMTIAFCSLAVGSLLLAEALRRSVETMRATPILLTVVGVLTFVSAAFRTDPNGAPATLHGQIHMAAGITTFVLLIATIATSVVPFHRSPRWRPFRTPSALWAAVAFGAFLLIPALGDAYFGVAQRTFVGACLSWMVLAAWLARRTDPSSERKPGQTTRAAASSAGRA